MALRSFNSVDGYSVGEDANIIVIYANGDISANSLTVSNSANLGNIANIIITGGANGEFIQTDGNGNLTFANIPDQVGGTNTTVQYNNANTIDGSNAFTFDNTSNTVSITGNLLMIDMSPVRFGANTSANYVAFQAPATIPASVTWKLPNVDGAFGNVLATDGTGNLYWRTTPTGNLFVYARSGPVEIETENGYLTVVSRTGNILVPIG